MLDLRVLGSTTIAVDGTTVDLGGPRQRAVLALLLVARGEVVSVDRLIEDLWRGEPPPRALGALQAYVSNLRRLLETRPGAARPCDPAGQPAARVRAAACGRRDRRPPLRGRPARCGRVCRSSAPARDARTRARPLAWIGARGVRKRTVGTAGGHPARGVAAQRARATHRRRNRRRRRDRGRAVGPRPDPGASAARGGLAPAGDRAVHPRPAGRRIGGGARRAHCARGRTGDRSRAGARGAGGRPARSADPAPTQTQPQHSPPAQPARPAPPPEPVRPAPPPGFVGRDSELHALRGAARPSRVALVSGEAGSGKSLLLERFRHELEADGWRIAVGRCPETEGAPPAWAWVEVLRTLTADVDPGPRAAALAPLLDDARTAEATADDGSFGRFTLHRAVAEYLARLEDACPPPTIPRCSSTTCTEAMPRRSRC